MSCPRATPWPLGGRSHVTMATILSSALFAASGQASFLDGSMTVSVSARFGRGYSPSEGLARD